MIVVATLTCGWCGRERDGFVGHLDKASGILLLLPTPPESGTRTMPRCASCGGPFFVDDWQPIAPPAKPLDLTARPGRPRRSAA